MTVPNQIFAWMVITDTVMTMIALMFFDKEVGYLYYAVGDMRSFWLVRSLVLICWFVFSENLQRIPQDSVLTRRFLLKARGPILPYGLVRSLAPILYGLGWGLGVWYAESLPSFWQTLGVIIYP